MELTSNVPHFRIVAIKYYLALFLEGLIRSNLCDSCGNSRLASAQLLFQGRMESYSLLVK